MSNALYRMIEKSQNNDEDSMLYILQKFEPLLLKYTKKLYYEDAFFDLQIELIEIIRDIPIEGFRECDEGRIISYICKSIYTRYIMLSKNISYIKQIHLIGDEYILEHLAEGYYDQDDLFF